MIRQNCQSKGKQPLSSFWPQSLRACSHRLNFFGKGITSIDRVPCRVQLLGALKEIDLSHNALSTLENMKQFPYVEVLNLSNNFIADGRELMVLQHLPYLTTTMVKGNPFLKSQLNLAEALTQLIPLNTDIETLPPALEDSFCQGALKLTVCKVQEQHHRRLEAHLQFTLEFNVQVAESGVQSCHLYHRLISEKLEAVTRGVLQRKEAFIRIMATPTQTTDGLSSKQQLMELFSEKLGLFIGRVEAEMEGTRKIIVEKEQLYAGLAQRKVDRGLRQGGIPEERRAKELSSFEEENSSNRPNDPQDQRGECPGEQPKASALRGQNREPWEGLSESKFEHDYYNLMMKCNPLYHLLYSPLHSLKDKEKDMLIEALSMHLKERTKALLKGQKSKAELSQLRSKCQALEAQLGRAQKTYLEYKQATAQNVGLMQASLMGKEAELSSLRGRAKSQEQQKGLLEEQLQDLNEAMNQRRLGEIRANHRLQKAETEEEHSEAIQQLREKRVKTHFLELLQKRAEAYHHYLTKRRENRKGCHLQTMRPCFEALRYASQYSHFEARFISAGLLKMRRNSMAQFRLNGSMGVKGRRASEVFKRVQVRLFIRSLRKRQQVCSIARSVATMTSGRVLRSWFDGWKEAVQEAKEADLSQQARSWHAVRLQRRAFHSWLVFSKQPVYKQAELTVELKSRKIRQFLFEVQADYFDRKELALKAERVELLLEELHKAKGYFCLKASVARLRELRASRENRLRKELRLKYLCELGLCAQAAKQERRSSEEKVRQVQLASKSKVFPHLKDSSCRAKHRKQHLCWLFQRFQRLARGWEIKESLKEFLVADRVRGQQIRSVFHSLSMQTMKKLRMRNKRQALELALAKASTWKAHRLGRMRHFLGCLLKPVRDQRRIRAHLSQRYYRTMARHFGEWRINMHQQQAEALKQQIHLFGPELDQITRRQKAAFEEKLVLMEVIESKERTIRNCRQQLEEAEYKVQSKEGKYNKLKLFCQERSANHLLDSRLHQTTFLGESRVPEHDYDSPFCEAQEIFKDFKPF